MSTTDNLNYLSGNRAVLTIPGLTDTNYTLQSFPLPDIFLPAARIESPFAVQPFMGDKVEYEPLKVSFIVNENLSNWLELHNWLRNLGAPEDKKEFRNKTLEFQDVLITVYNSHNNPILGFKFIDCVPTRLQGIDFTETISETEHKVVTFELEYQRYDISFI